MPDSPHLAIAMFVPGMKFDLQTIETASLGGSETAALQLAMALGRRGHSVTIYNGADRPDQRDNVRVIPADDATFISFMVGVPHDVLIVQRLPQMFAFKTHALLNVLWLHDLAQARQREQYAGIVWNLDLVATVSGYAALQVEQALGLDPCLLWPARNGIDNLLLPDDDEIEERDPCRIVYAARPERGLDVLLTRVFPGILEREPSATLHIYGYDHATPQMMPFYRACRQAAARFGPAVTWHEPLDKRSLYRAYAESGLYLYPSPSPQLPGFREVSCISAIEAMATGLPFVGSENGALPETLGVEPNFGVVDRSRPGFLVPGTPADEGHCERLISAALEIMHDPTLADGMGEAGKARAPFFYWDDIAADWEAVILGRIDSFNDDPHRLARHFARRQDHEAALTLANRERLDGKGSKNGSVLWEPITAAALEQAGGILESPSAATGYYADNPEPIFERPWHGHWQEHLKNPALTRTMPPMRPALIANTIKSWRDNGGQPCRRALDFGGQYGGIATLLHNHLGLKVDLIDADPCAVQAANELFDRQCEGYPDHGCTAYPVLPLSGGFDVAVLAEVAEHVHDPLALLHQIEERLRPGGLVVITAPYGPWEEGGDSRPEHVREIDAQSWREIGGDRPGFNMTANPVGESPHSRTALGFYVISWEKDPDRPLGRIDWERKFRLQRPRETLSVCYMLGGPHCDETLHWSLRSVAPIADEIVVADTGMTAEARRIVKRYGAKVVQAPDALSAGFEAGRNVALGAATMDWVLWLDADEHLVGANELPKYLRRNRLNGYAIKQHHHAIDTAWPPDMPCRLFRRGGWNGEQMRFFGVVHEHPELTAVNGGPGPILAVSEMGLSHVGYLSESIRQERFARNLPLLERDALKYPERRLTKHLLCRDKIILVRRLRSQHGGRLTEEAARLCEEVIELYRENFLGHDTHMARDTTKYYSEAAGYLGCSIRVGFDMAASRDGVGDAIVGEAYTFASIDDARRELMARAEAKLDRLNREDW